MFNPYQDINWGGVILVPSCSHQHCETQEQFNNIIASGMYRHYAFSNYYPSAPVYPLSSKFSNIPQDAISCPNEENHATSSSALHFNGVGCTKISGSERHWVDGDWVYDQPVGWGRTPWKTAFKEVLATLLYADGGGITINHPAWSDRHGGLNQATIENMLDFDERVLGIEVYNAQEEDWDTSLWHELLMKKYKCFGFAASDHIGQFSGSPKGRNVLLSSDASEHDCLRAYREGRFYGQLHNTSLAFSGIAVNGSALSVTTVGANTISVIIDGVKTTYSGNAASVSIPSGFTYMRVEADSDDDKIWSNPILSSVKRSKPKSSFNDLIVYM